MTAKFYTQCRLRQGNAHAVAWIETRGAKRGALVEIPDLSGLWQVATVSAPPVSADWLYEKQRVDRKGMPDI